MKGTSRFLVLCVWSGLLTFLLCQGSVVPPKSEVKDDLISEAVAAPAPSSPQIPSPSTNKEVVAQAAVTGNKNKPRRNKRPRPKPGPGKDELTIQSPTTQGQGDVAKAKDGSTKLSPIFPWLSGNSGGWSSGNSGWGPGPGWQKPGTLTNPATCLPPGSACDSDIDCCQFAWGKPGGWSSGGWTSGGGWSSGGWGQGTDWTNDGDVQCMLSFDEDYQYSTCCIRIGRLGCGTTDALCCGYDYDSETTDFYDSIYCKSNMCYMYDRHRSGLNETSHE